MSSEEEAEVPAEAQPKEQTGATRQGSGGSVDSVHSSSFSLHHPHLSRTGRLTASFRKGMLTTVTTAVRQRSASPCVRSKSDAQPFTIPTLAHSSSTPRKKLSYGLDTDTDFMLQFCTGPAYLPALTCIVNHSSASTSASRDASRDDGVHDFSESQEETYGTETTEHIRWDTLLTVRGTSEEMAQERTFLAIKPDAVQRGLISDVIGRFEKKGYKLVAMKMLVPPKELLHKHYGEHVGKPFFEPLVNYMNCGPVVAMVWQGRNVITASRSIVGSTRPLEAAPGTIRGDFAIDVGRNIVHGSDAPESAKREIDLWFTAQEQFEWNRETEKWIYE